jgi:hypothetical protein
MCGLPQPKLRVGALCVDNLSDSEWTYSIGAEEWIHRAHALGSDSAAVPDMFLSYRVLRVVPADGGRPGGCNQIGLDIRLTFLVAAAVADTHRHQAGARIGTSRVAC